MRRTRALLAIGLLALLVADAQAQRFGRGWGRPTEPEITWELDAEFEHDVFTFCRVIFDSYDGGWLGGWANDYPQGDWNFSYRLHQLTSMKVDPNGIALRFTDPKLTNYPFLYMANVNQMALDDREAKALREHLLNGGFLMADDFWSAPSWRHVKQEMKKVFPDRLPQELKLDHPIFHLVYDLKVLPQVPSADVWRRGDMFEYHHGPTEGDEDPHFQAYLDDQGHVMALFCHNNDIGDGWEREGVDEEYFREFSEKFSYPLGINIVTYALTH